MNSETITSNFAAISAAIAQAAASAGRTSAEVLLVAVTKGQADAKVREFIEACKAQGTRAVCAENYVQTFLKRPHALTADCENHFIGSLQSNKVKLAVEHFDLIQSVHSQKLLELIHAEAQKRQKIQKVLLQVNISDDEAKGGFTPTQVKACIREILPQLVAVSCLGLMTITRYYENREEVRPDFKSLRLLRDEILADAVSKGYFGDGKFELSMGMSQDYDIAVEEGATIVRVGTALFGERV